MTKLLRDYDFIQILESIPNFETEAQRDRKRLCEIFTANRKLIEAIIPYISKIPVYGEKIASIMRLLIEIADHVCV